ncbi:MAG: YlmH/Sll1252 family protein [Oscillospiraceae bacterium]|nr:YlmH/Sll1252 family protein [Oscillospiraceae bacterium]
MARRAAARGDVQFTAFLNERESELARAALCAYKEVSCAVYGGYPNAQRVMMGIWESRAPQEGEFPIKAVKIHCKGAEKLTHRDFLGALIGFGISRDHIGDILVEDGCRAFCWMSDPAAGLCLAQPLEIGSFLARAEATEEPVTEILQRPQREGSFFAASLRVDAVLAGMLRIGRAEAETLIDKSNVQVNHMLVETRSFLLQQEDVLSVRGYGKYKITQVGGTSKKGRLYLEWIQY